MAGKKKKTPKIASSKKFRSKKRSLEDFGFAAGDDSDVEEAKSRRTQKKTQGGAAKQNAVEEELQDLTRGLGEEIDALLNEEKPAVITAAEDDVPPPTNNYFEMLGEADDEDADDSLLPDPVALVEKAISADLDPSVFSGKSFPVASNVIEFCRDPDYLGFTGDLFPKQIQVLAHYFRDVCYFCSDTDYIHDVPVDDPVGDVLDRFTLLRYGVCPRCKRNRTEILQDWINDPRYEEHSDLDPNVAAKVRPVPPNEFVGVWGQRSGKSYTVGTFAFPYILHRYLALPSPTKYFRIPSNQVLEAAFVAPTLHQITKYVWTPFREAYAASPWFKEVRESLLYEGKRLGAALYREGERFLVFPGKNLAVHILAASSSGLRGGTRVFCVDGGMLVNTTRGLIPMRENLSGSSAWLHNSQHDIVRHQETGKRPVQRTILENGYSVVTTLDHRIKTLTPDLNEEWKEAADLKVGDYVAVNLGAKFPETLHLAYDPQRPVHRQLEAYKLMSRLKTFTSKQLFAETGLKGIYALTHRLIKRGMLEKVYVKGQGRGAGCVYNLTNSFDLDTIITEHENHAFKDRDICTFPDEMTVELGYLLGYYVAEGSYEKDAPEFSFSNTNESVVEHFIQCFEKVFGFTPRYSTFESSPGVTAYNVVVAYKVVKNFLRYLGMSPSSAPTKTIPWSILQSPREAVLAFLSAYIEGDGTISDKYISMGTTSRKLVQQLQLLLLNVGVLSKISRTPRDAPWYDLWSLRLRRFDSVKLAPQLSCVSKGRLFNYDIGKKFHHDYRIPYIPAFVDTSLHGGNTAKYAYVLNELNEDSYDSYALKHLSAENPQLYDKTLKLVDNGVVWLSVVGTRPLGSRPVYDLTVDSHTHAFSANGIVVHNCSLDELGWFNSTEDGKKRSGVKEGGAVFDALDNSLNTIRSRADDRRDNLGDYDVLDGHMFNISSPCTIGDPIMTRAARAPKAPRMHYTHYATWEVNPNEREDRIRERMAGDMDRFLRNWAAIPPRALSPFFQDTELVASLARKEERDESIFKYYIEQYAMEGESIVRLRPHLQNVQADPYNARILAVDNGEVNNSFALCVARYDPELDKLHYEEFVEVAPYRGRVVDLYWCYENFIVPLANSFNFLHVCFDRWNSSSAYHDLQTNQGFNASTGKDARIYTLKWPDFEAFREDLRGMNMSFPQTETEPDELLNIKDLSRRAATPRAHALLQLTTVEQFGRKVMKPDQGNDDLFRVAVLAHRFVRKNKKKYAEFSQALLRRRDNFRSVAIFRGASQRGAGGMGAFQEGTRPANARPVGLVRSRSSFSGPGRKVQ